MRDSPWTLASIVLAVLMTAGAFMATLQLTPVSAPATTSAGVQLTHGTAAHVDPAFSPDGKQIAFASNQSGSFDIWLVTTEGRQLTRLTSFQGDEVLPEWSPDGRSISFIWMHGPSSDLCIAQTVGAGAECITHGRHVQSYAWSPVGNVIAYDDASEGDIHLYHFLGGVESLFPFNGTVKNPAFGAGSDELYFAANTGKGFNIWNATIGGAIPRRLSWLGSDAMPRVSPTNDRVLYLTNLSGRTEPWLIDLTTGINRYLFHRPDLQPAYAFGPSPPLAVGDIPRWSPNGSQILMISSQNGSAGSLYLATLSFPVDLAQQSSQLGAIPIVPLNIFNRVTLKSPVLDARWSPDGRSVVLISELSRSAQLVLLRNGPAARIGYGG